MQQERLTWFDNPPKRRKGHRRKLYGAAAKAHAKKVRSHTRKGAGRTMAKRRKLYGAAAKAHARRMGRGSYKKSQKRTTHRARPRARARHRRSSVVAASRAGRTLRYRRPNPPFRGILGSIMGGAIDGAWVLAGEAGVGFISNLVPFGQGGGAAGIAVQLGSALALGWVARKISPNASKMILAGALAKIERGFAKNLPVVGAYLGEGEGYYAVGSYPMGGYPQVTDGLKNYPAMSAYPGADMGDPDPSADGSMY